MGQRGSKRSRFVSVVGAAVVIAVLGLTAVLTTGVGAGVIVDDTEEPVSKATNVRSAVADPPSDDTKVAGEAAGAGSLPFLRSPMTTALKVTLWFLAFGAVLTVVYRRNRIGTVNRVVRG